MSRSIALSASVAILVFLGATPSATGQVYHWLDAQMKPKQSPRFADVPASAMATLRCSTRVLEVLSGETIRVEGGHRIRLTGIDAPDGDLSWNKPLAESARAFLTRLALNKAVDITFDTNFKDANFETLGYVTTKEGVFLNQAMLAAGLAAPLHTGSNKKHTDTLNAACAAAKKAKKGMWTTTVSNSGLRSKIRGFSLGLYSRDPDYDYTPFLKEQAAIGCTDVLLITPWFLDHYTSCTMVPKKHRSTPLPMVGRVVRQARKLGLRVAIMPIVLLWEPGDDHWRGNIEPRDADDWFLSYQEFIGSFASLASENGAAELVVGSEFSSLERDESHWREVIRGVRQRFGGVLSYSANWDHLTVIQFWDALDAVGMTGYHSLTKKNDPSVAELKTAWRRIRAGLEKELQHVGKPYYFSELGYASLDGINKNPWDYVSPKKIDWQEQADCFRAYLEVWQDAPPRFLGAYFYTWWRNKDDDDKRQYTVFGKPAEEVIRKWFQAK